MSRASFVKTFDANKMKLWGNQGLEENKTVQLKTSFMMMDNLEESFISTIDLDTKVIQRQAPHFGIEPAENGKVRLGMKHRISQENLCAPKSAEMSIHGLEHQLSLELVNDKSAVKKGRLKTD